eukprot:14203918-Heterocapsa_arctica.AAC.1
MLQYKFEGNIISSTWSRSRRDEEDGDEKGTRPSSTGGSRSCVQGLRRPVPNVRGVLEVRPSLGTMINRLGLPRNVVAGTSADYVWDDIGDL